MQLPLKPGVARTPYPILPFLHLLTWLVVGATACLAAPTVAAVRPLLGWEALGRLDRLAEYKPTLEVGCVSSYDRTGGNDDGFSGKYSYVRQEDGACVIADLQGPGVIYRIWTPTPTDDWMEFFFDGESAPRVRVRFRDLFLGATEPFVKPLVGYGVGGFFCYVPMPYERSCRIVIRAKRVQFYQVNYARYGADAGIRTFSPQSDGASREALAVRALWGRSGEDLSSQAAPPGTRASTTRKSVSLSAGRTATLLDTRKPGRIVGLRLSPASVLAGKARDVLLRISFDGGKPSVLCPVGDFFGFAWGDPAMRSLVVGSTAREAYCHYPMPFDRSARVELVSERASGDPVEFTATVTLADRPRQLGEGRFAAVWRRENPTTIGQPFTFVEATGRGHLVGFVLQSQGFESGQTLFFEGDDQTWLDGKLAVHGTGSEDFLNGGWYDVPDRWEKRLSFPLSGCLGYQKHLGRTGGYRLLVGDAYSYTESVRQTIEHSGTGNDISTDYVGVTYLYTDQPLATPLVPKLAEQRAVRDFTEVQFPAGWQIPIRAFPFQDAILTRKSLKIGNEDVRFLSLRGGVPDWVGVPYLLVSCEVPTAGRYTIAIEAVRGPEQGVVQLFQDEAPVGEAVDLYAPTPTRSGRVILGVMSLQAGDNPVMFKLVRKQDAASAIGLDLVRVICTRIE